LVSSKNTRQVRIKPYKGPVGGWGSVKVVTEILLREAIPVKGSVALWRQNKPRGFACVSCSYGRPPHSAFEFCENGAKATAWEITDKRCSPEFFAEHTVIQIVTKLNRGAIIHGGAAYLLPCLGRIEIDRQATGVQFVTVEDTTGRFHASHGQAEPASKDLLSEPKIVAELAKSTLAPNPKVDWDAWSGNYALVRDAIAETYPAIFKNFNERIKNPAGFDRPLPARERKWTTPNGKANFISPRSLSEDPDLPRTRVGVLTLITLRSNDQFNTTVYGLDDRLRGINGTRMVVLMNKADIEEHGLRDGDEIDLLGAAADAVPRVVRGLRVVAYNVPQGSCAGYYPECNPLLPLWHHAEGSHVPAAKSIPVRVHKRG
jgi:anaerobic selenocysteine-containing dehydrogenase